MSSSPAELSPAAVHNATTLAAPTASLAAAIEVAASAKINYWLRVLGKRDDGYHELDSLMVKLELADRLQLAITDDVGIRLSCPGSDLPVGPDNLVYRAAQAFFDHCRRPPAVAITLWKKIPVAAGLGGGSSDAAAVLRGLDRLCATGLSDEVLLALARPLGADVPFFVQSAPVARARGIGERLTPAALPAGISRIVLVNPGFAVSTKWVYDNFPLTKQSDPDILTGCPALPEMTPVNDLEAVTMVGYPELATIREDLLAGGAEAALLAGSGPTVFGLFARSTKAAECAAQLQQKWPTVILTRPLAATEPHA